MVQESVGALKKQMRAFCMVASDLHLLCHMIQQLFHLTAGPGTLVAIDDLNSVMKVPSPVDKKCFLQTKIQFLTTVTSCKAASKLLQSFRGMIHGSQRLNITGYGDALKEDVGRLRDLMGPKAIWVNALAWDVLQTVQRDKARARKFIEAGDYPSAGMAYSWAVNLFDRPWLFGLPLPFYRYDASLPFALLCIAILDSAVMATTLWVHVDRGERIHFKGMTTALAEMIAFFLKLPEATKVKASSNSVGVMATQGAWPLACCRALWWSMLIALSQAPDGKAFLATALPTMLSLQTALNGDTHFEHDLQLLKTLTSNREVSI